MPRAALLATLGVAMLDVGCKAPVDHSSQDEIDATRLRNEMCACLDEACRKHVRDKLEVWQHVVADRNSPEPLAPKAAEMLAALQSCDALHASAPTPSPLPSGAASAPTASAALPTDPHPSVAAFLAELWRQAREDDDPDLQLRSVHVSYVRSDGTLDATYGEIKAATGFPEPVPPRPPDDSTRPTGAPIPVLPAPPRKTRETCPELEWSARTGWEKNGWTCYLGGELLGRQLRCSVVELWKRAIAKGAPPDALAVIRLQPGPNGNVWSFRITDELRGVHVSLDLPDDCDPVVEK